MCDTPVSRVMTTNPVVIGPTDSVLLKRLPDIQSSSRKVAL